MQRLKKAFRAVLVGATAAGAAACDDGLTDINRNPNEPTEIGAEYLFTNGVEASVSRALGAGLSFDLTGLWIQHYAESRYTEQDRYEFTDGTVQTHWTGFYAGPLQDFTEVIAQGEAQGRPNVSAMGRVMRAWTFHIVTDLWGDIGYTDALRGREAGSGNKVEYDPQEEVYAAVLGELRLAAGSLDPAGVRMRNADLLYGGDPVKWRRFANALRLRMAMRMADADAAAARAEFTAALQDGVFTGNADNAVLWYLANGANEHPIYSYELNRIDHAVSATMVDSLASLADPRLGIYANRNAFGEYRGDRPGDIRDVPLDSLSRVGNWFSRADAPSYLMTYAEVLFLRAEAAERDWIDGDPAALYRQAITAHMQMLGVAQGEIDAYLAQNRVAYAGLPSIGLQKWIALYGNGPEAYAEWRRTGYPSLVAGPDALNDGRIPVRLPYPASEESLNAAAVQAAMSRQNGATINSPLWWDR